MSGTISSLTGASGTSASSAASRLAGDMDTFLKLLTTQLMNQDPTAPMDADQLTQQLVQFATVEQQVNTNATMQQLVNLQQASQLGEAAALVGRYVAVESDRLPLQSGSALVNLPAAGAAQTARIEIRDANNLLVRTSDVTLGEAAGTWVWDGQDGRGTQRADGTYRITVSGRDSTGAAVTIGHTVGGLVTGAVRDNGAVMLRMGGLSVGYDKLRDMGT